LRNTFDTAVVDTLACWATSTIVTRRGCADGSIGSSALMGNVAPEV
jgi:hypothetical protein